MEFLERSNVFGDPKSVNVFLQPVDAQDLSRMEEETESLKALCGHEDWCILAVPVANWNRDLTPWSAPPVFGKEGFGDGAAASLDRILKEIIPSFEAAYPAREAADMAHDAVQVCHSLAADGSFPRRRYFLAGYSLAGLFVLWAGYQSATFAGVAAVSPSVWYPGWSDWAAGHVIRTPRVYLSLGDREEKTRNLLMSQVGACIRRQEAMLKQHGTDVTLEWNPGNHFVDPAMRTAKGMAWLLR